MAGVSDTPGFVADLGPPKWRGKEGKYSDCYGTSSMLSKLKRHCFSPLTGGGFQGTNET